MRGSSTRQNRYNPVPGFQEEQKGRNGKKQRQLSKITRDLATCMPRGWVALYLGDDFP